MNTVFVVQSVEGHYFGKQGQWLSGKEPNFVFVGKYKDDALNQLIDITLKNVDVRARVVETQLNARNLPILEIIADSDLISAEDFSMQEQYEQLTDDNKPNSLSA